MLNARELYLLGSFLLKDYEISGLYSLYKFLVLIWPKERRAYRLARQIAECETVADA